MIALKMCNSSISVDMILNKARKQILAAGDVITAFTYKSENLWSKPSKGGR